MAWYSAIWHGVVFCNMAWHGILWYGKLEWATEFGEIPTLAFWTDGYGWHNSFETKCMECIEQERDIVNIKWTDSWERISRPPLSFKSRTNIRSTSQQISWLCRTILISLQQISWIEVGNYPIFTSKNGKNMNELKRTNIGHYRNYRDVYFFQAGVLFSIWRSRIVSLFHCRFTHFLVYF